MGEVAWWLEGLAVLVEDLSIIPSTHIGQLTNASDSTF